jgi:hypothetical protein
MLAEAPLVHVSSSALDGGSVAMERSSRFWSGPESSPPPESSETSSQIAPGVLPKATGQFCLADGRC